MSTEWSEAAGVVALIGNNRVIEGPDGRFDVVSPEIGQWVWGARRAYAIDAARQYARGRVLGTPYVSERYRPDQPERQPAASA